MIDQILNDQKSRMKKAVENTAREMAVIRTGKASPALLDNIRIECWGGTSSNKTGRRNIGPGAPSYRNTALRSLDIRCDCSSYTEIGPGSQSFCRWTRCKNPCSKAVR